MYAVLRVKCPLFLTPFGQYRNVPIHFPKNPLYEFPRKFNQWESRYCVGTDRQILHERNRLFYARAQQLAKVPSNVSLAILQILTATIFTSTVACYDVTFETDVCFKFRYRRPWKVTVRTTVKESTEGRTAEKFSTVSSQSSRPTL